MPPRARGEPLPTASRDLAAVQKLVQLAGADPKKLGRFGWPIQQGLYSRATLSRLKLTRFRGEASTFAAASVVSAFHLVVCAFDRRPGAPKICQEDHPDSLWAGQVQGVLQTGLAVRDRCNDGELSEHGLASVRGRLVAQLGRLIDARHRWTTPSASPGIWPPNSLPCFSSCGTCRSTPPTGAPNRPSVRRRYPQGLRWQPHPSRRRQPAGAGQRRAHRPPTRPRPSSADRHDVARCRSRRPRRLRASAAARVRGATPERPLPKRDRSPRLPAAKDTVQRRHPRLGCRLCAAGVSNGCRARQPADLALRAQGKPTPIRPRPTSYCGMVTMQPWRQPA